MYEIASIEQAEKPGIPSKLFPLGIDQKEKEMHIVHLIGALQPAQGLRTIPQSGMGRALKAPWLRMLDPLLEDVERATAIQTHRDRMRARFRAIKEELKRRMSSL